MSASLDLPADLRDVVAVELDDGWRQVVGGSFRVVERIVGCGEKKPFVRFRSPYCRVEAPLWALIGVRRRLVSDGS